MIMDIDIFHAAVAAVIIDTVPVELPQPDVEFGQDTMAYKKQFVYLNMSGVKYYLRIAFDVELDPCYLIIMRPSWLSITREDDIEMMLLGRVDHYTPEFQVKVWDLILKDFRRNCYGPHKVKCHTL